MTTHWFVRSTLALVVALAALSPHARVIAGARQDPPPQISDISAEALAQIEALLREKGSRSAVDRKIDSQLLYQLRMEASQPIATGVPRIETDIPYAGDGHVVVDVKVRRTSGLLASLATLGIEVVSVDQEGSALRLHIDVAQVQQLAALPDVRFIQPRQDARTSQAAQPNVLVTQTGQGSRSSEGDVTHLAAAARAAFGATGVGIKIGVLSDGVTSLAASQAAGDLGPVTVLAGQAGSGDEGTAMLEIIHDLAPGAQLYFATAFNGITSFADNIRALRAAGCDIIVDDVFYFVESPFQDGQAPGVLSNTNGGVVTQAVNDVTASGALYFSSAGNSGNLNASTSSTWEGDFVDGGASPGGLTAGRLHRFGLQTYNVLTVGGDVPANLYWSDPLGGSKNDYDLFRLNSAGTQLLAASTNIQSGTQDPYEQVSGTGALANDRFVIVKKTGAANRFLHLSALGAPLSIATAGEIHGHAAAAAAFAVAATPAVGPFPQPFSLSNMVESFSSDGPRRLFYQASGTPFTAGDLSSTGGLLRQKPDITAADGVSVTGVGGFPSPFYGTSAAAPHAAAIAGLLKSANIALTSADIRGLLTSSAIDIGAAGVDRDSGAGIIMADAVLRAAGIGGTSLLEVSNVTASDNPGNGNGAPEAGEGARLIIPLANYGGALATSVSATLTSSTPGVTVTQPSTRAFADIPVSTSASSGSPFLFTLASNFPCPQSASFTLTVTSGGGPSPRVFTFLVPIGPPAYSITTTLDSVAPPGSTGVTTTTGTQNRRLTRDQITSSCGAPKAAPASFGSGTRRFEAFAFNTCSFSAPSCVTVTLQGANAINLFTAAYSPAFTTNNLQQNYKGDPGASGSVQTYSFDLAGGPRTFVVNVHEVDSGGGIGTQYTLNVAGACGGACAPPNRVPVAVATAVTVTAGVNGTAFASIDGGSSDADGDPLTRTQSPAGPYPIGQTSVVLSVSDPKGATSQASAMVTVLGPPTISIADATVTEGDAGTVNAAFLVTLSSASSTTITVAYSTADQTAIAPADYAAASNVVAFAPGEVAKTVTVVVNGDTRYEASETFTVNLVSPTNATLADAQAVGTILTDDALTVNDAAVTQAVTTGGARLQALQRSDGGWFFTVGDTHCLGSTVSCPNTVGITGLGLLAGYTRTGNTSLLTSAVAAGDFLVAQYNGALLKSPPALPFSQDVEFLVELGQLTGNALYTSTAEAWFQLVMIQYPIAAARIDWMMTRRAGQGLVTVAAWDAASFIRSAKAVGEAGYGHTAALRIREREPEWNDPNFPVEYRLLAQGSLLWAFHDLPGFEPQINQYRSFLVAQQDASGSWFGETQVSSYAVLGLAAAGGAGAAAAIESAVGFFLANELGTGGWPGSLTAGGPGPEYTEIDAEVVRALFTLYSTQAGSNVAVTPAQLASVSFSQVMTSGFTSVVATNQPAGTTVARGFAVLADLNYEVLTTAKVRGQSVVCFSVPWIADAATFANVRILHAEGGVLVNRTIRSPRRLAPDFATRRVCARVSSLSHFAVALRDTTPPSLSVTLTPAALWPADHRMVTVTATVSASDDSDPAPTVRLVSITSSEADKGRGGGDHPRDIRGARIGTDDRTFRLRAERSSRAGRVYTVVYRATDSSGNTRDVTSRVVVTLQP